MSSESQANTRALLIAAAPPGFDAPDSFWARLTSAYAEPQRHYHNLEHLEELAAHFVELAAEGRWQDPHSVYYALLCHDAVYEISAKDNESKSADLAEQWYHQELSHLDIDLARVRQLIEWTAVHGRLSASTIDEEAALFLDCDMAILAAPPERFARYDREIEAEQCQVHPRWAFKLGRKAFIRSLLKSPRLYLSEHFHARLENRARENLSRL